MSITTYNELKTAVANWLKRGDLTSYVADLIQMGEARLNRNLRLFQMENEATITFVDGQAYNSLPTGFLDVVDFYYSDTLVQIDQLPIRTLNEYKSSSEGRPKAYAISGTILYERPSDSSYTGKMRYIKKWDIAADATNWLLTNYPDAYVFSALAEAEPFLKNDKRVALWESKAQRTIDELNDLDSRARGKAKLRMDDGLSNHSTYNITTNT